MLVLLLVLSLQTLLLVTVKSHSGGHGGDSQIKKFNAIQDALLSYLCRGSNGLPCNGHGSCSSGICTCYVGYSDHKCDLYEGDMSILAPVDESVRTNNNVEEMNLHDLLSSSSTDEKHIMACIATDINACNRHGFCHEGDCLCEPGRSGITCELSHELGFCNTYKECAECTAFMEQCPKKCGMMANFRLVFGFPIKTKGSTFRKCRFKNVEYNCNYYFKQESENAQGMKTIIVKACLAHRESTTNNTDALEQLKDTPIQPDTSSQNITVVGTPDSEVEVEEDAHADDTGETGKQDSTQGDSGTSLTKPEVVLVFGSLIMMLKL